MTKFIDTIIIILSFPSVGFNVSSCPKSKGRLICRHLEDAPYCGDNLRLNKSCKSPSFLPFSASYPPIHLFFHRSNPNAQQWEGNFQHWWCQFMIITNECELLQNQQKPYFQFPSNIQHDVQNFEEATSLLPFIQRSSIDIYWQFFF